MNTNPQTKKAVGPQLGSRNHFKHGYYSLKAKLQGKDIDKRTAVYKALAEQEQELLLALGGSDNVSPQERIIIADTVKHLLFAAALDRYLMQLKSIVRKGKVHCVVGERTRIGAHIKGEPEGVRIEARA
jgi:hypothetical protein